MTDPERASIDAGRLNVVSTRQGDEHVMTIHGVLDLHSAACLGEELRRVERTDAARIIVDLTHLRLVDRSGVRLIVQAQVRSRRNGDRLLFIRAREPVDRVFRLTGADRLLTFID
jgi:anti-anti-sigma factor